jgi:hypothetical protein
LRLQLRLRVPRRINSHVCGGTLRPVGASYSARSAELSTMKAFRETPWHFDGHIMHLLLFVTIISLIVAGPASAIIRNAPSDLSITYQDIVFGATLQLQSPSGTSCSATVVGTKVLATSGACLG